MLCSLMPKRWAISGTETLARRSELDEARQTALVCGSTLSGFVYRATSIKGVVGGERQRKRKEGKETNTEKGREEQDCASMAASRAESTKHDERSERTAPLPCIGELPRGWSRMPRSGDPQPLLGRNSRSDQPFQLKKKDESVNRQGQCGTQRIYCTATYGMR